jgi:ABC-type multidrug transport system ATPase subunit
LFEILRDVNARGTAVLIVEQFVHMALGNTDRAYVLAKGEVVLEGRSADLLADPQLIASYLGESAAGSAEKAAATGAASVDPARTAAPRKRRTSGGTAQPGRRASGRGKKSEKGPGAAG